jgi:hypothetical protein
METRGEAAAQKERRTGKGRQKTTCKFCRGQPFETPRCGLKNVWVFLSQAEPGIENIQIFLALKCRDPAFAASCKVFRGRARRRSGAAAPRVRCAPPRTRAPTSRRCRSARCRRA